MASSHDDHYRERLPNIRRIMAAKLRSICSPTTITKKLPILAWLPKYKPHYLLQDCIAGVTVGLTSIPQSIAYGIVAGLEPQYGLYSAFLGCFTYVFFGNCKDVIIAGTAPMALFIHDYAVQSVDYVSLISFLVGCIILIFGLLNLGVLVRFISLPVITGFTLAAATTIASAQINNIFGMKGPSNDFLPAWKFLFTHLPQIRWTDSLLGISSLIFLILMNKIKDIPYGPKYLWKYVSLLRNSMIVIIGMLLAYYLSDDGYEPFKITGNITKGIPPFAPPSFIITVNGTQVPTEEMLNRAKSALLSIPLVAILEIMAISKAFSKGKVVDATQEMIALGMCNVMGSFVKSMPCTGSFTRTSVNNASGVRTPLGGAFAGLMVLLALAFLTDTFYYIPKTTLAAVIMSAMLSLVEFDVIVNMWKSKKFDLIPFFVTFVTCLFWDLEYGILCGVGINCAHILYTNARPEVIITQRKVFGHEVCTVDVKQRVFYAGAEYLREKILRHNMREPSNRLVIIRGEEINSIDFTVATNIICLQKDLTVNKVGLILWNWNLKSAGVLYRLNVDSINFFKNDMTLDAIVQEYFQVKSNFSSENVAVLA